MNVEALRLRSFDMDLWPLPGRRKCNPKNVRLCSHGMPHCPNPLRQARGSCCKSCLTACHFTQMAKAGFYHTPTEASPDLVQCYCCHKELDGWEPSDDPMCVRA